VRVHDLEVGEHALQACDRAIGGSVVDDDDLGRAAGGVVGPERAHALGERVTGLVV
jgi:hypothetical protein